MRLDGIWELNVEAELEVLRLQLGEASGRQAEGERVWAQRLATTIGGHAADVVLHCLLLVGSHRERRSLDGMFTEAVQARYARELNVKWSDGLWQP